MAWWLLVACAAVDEGPRPIDSGEPETDRPFPSDLTGDPEAGAAAFQLYCATCHGEAGRGGLGPDLAVASVALDDEQIFTTMIEGIRRRMPPLDVTDQEAVDILAWLRQQFPR